MYPIQANGMTNPGAACYAISTVQALRSLDYVVSALNRFPRHRLCQLLLHNNSYIGDVITEVNACNRTNFSTGMQADSDEFYIHLVDALPDPVKNLFQVRRQGYLICESCKNSRETEARDLEEVQLHINANPITPITVIREHGDTDKACEKCNYPNMIRQDIIRRVSEIICIHPKATNLQDYPDKFVIKVAGAQRIYSLQSATYYSGDGNGGHYWAGGYRGTVSYNFNDGSATETKSVRVGARPRLLFYELEQTV